MAIPDYQSLMLPVLRISESGPIRVRDAISVIGDGLNLTDEEKSERLPSQKQATFDNRVHWAKTYLKQAGLIRYPQRGHFQITEAGRELLAQNPSQISNDDLKDYDAFQDFKSRSSSDEVSDIDPTHAQTDQLSQDVIDPEEQVLTAYKKIQDSLAADLLSRVQESSPEFFERLIAQLFVAMGYGGSQDEARKDLRPSGADDGVDGVIDQDVLGIDQIYLQAKRYQSGNNVSSSAIRDFYGAISMKRASKGIFVTTSGFTLDAVRTAKEIGQRIVLIDGKKLSSLMVKYNIGCRIEQALEIKKTDEEYFED
jgi:restriction system protein